jgi:hypothetical protein
MEEKKGFYWERQAEAEKTCLDLLEDCKRKNSYLAHFEHKLVQLTSSRLFDWADHIVVQDTKRTKEILEKVGFVKQHDTRYEALYHPGALLPRIVITGQSSGMNQGVALRVDNIGDFLQANGYRAEIEGGPLTPYRRAVVGMEERVGMMVVERRGTMDYDPVSLSDIHQQNYLEGVEAWQKRPRHGENEDDIFGEIFRIADRLVRQLGTDTAATIVCQCERAYWLSRNFAARVQRGRHDTLGMGWANHDHHTFRSSRRNFYRLVDLFTKLGFQNRERFYAGAEAGWGAQVMENVAAGLVLFLDVDLAPEEVATEFFREQLKDMGQLGTVGLWCALHGDSILHAGMHHFAARYDFARLIADLARLGVGYMTPFSNFPYFKQAFSIAERWETDPARVTKLIKDKSITNEQGERFFNQGAVGSHLENIERREGYKGFNRKNVSAIIRQTDPRGNMA